MLWVWVVSLPVILLNSPVVNGGSNGARSRPDFGTGTDIAGVILWAIGIIWETAADVQKVSLQIKRERESQLKVS